MSPTRARVLEVDTSAGPARVHLLRPTRPRGAVVLGHGAGGGIDAPDLVALTTLAEDGWLVARLEQPWRVAGRRVAAPPAQLDAAFLTVIAELRRRRALPAPLVSGGRSAGARVACRTAMRVGAAAVLALSFPLAPPMHPDRSRAHEAVAVLDAGLPLAVVQGRLDPFGAPSLVRAALGRRAAVYEVPGTHDLRAGCAQLLAAVRAWLDAACPAG